MDQLQKIDLIIQEFQLQEIRDEIYENLVERIAIETTEKEDYSKLGNSRIGGFPDLPIDWEYPMNTKGEYLRFLYQINLAELPAHKLLAKSGIIYVFEGDFDDTDFKFLFSKSKNIKLSKYPEDKLPCSGWDYSVCDALEGSFFYPSFKVKFYTDWQIKYSKSIESFFDETNRESLSLYFFAKKIPDAFLFGFCDFCHTDFLHDIPSGSPDDWIPLIHLNSIDKTMMYFGDIYSITTLIKKESLKKWKS